MQLSKNSLNLNLINLLWISIGSISTLLLLLFCRQANLRQWFAPGILILLSFICFLFYDKKKLEQIAHKLLVGIILTLVVQFLYLLFKYSLQVKEWDFLVFYLFAKSGLSGGNFYDPALYHSIFQALEMGPLVSEGFVRDIVDIGFWYPPPTMLLFIPLGWFDIKTSFYLWQSIISLFLIADIYLVITIFTPDLKQILKSSSSLTLIVLILIFPGLTDAVFYNQTSTILLFLFLLMLKNPNHWTAGVWLCLVILIKPIAVVFGLYVLLFRKWKIMASAAATGLLILLLTVLVFGADIFNLYFSSLPTSRMSDTVFLEAINTSLNSVLLRLQANHYSVISLSLTKAVFYFLVASLTSLTIYFSYRARESSPLLSILIFVPLALIIYPGTLSHYVLFLLPVVLFIFIEFKENKKSLFALGILLALYTIGIYSLFYFSLITLAVLYYLLKFRSTESTVIS